MIKQLQKAFPSLRTFHEQNEFHDDYEWFITSDNEVIGILKQELSARDQSILSAFLQPYQITFPKRTRKEHIWHQLIFESNDSAAHSFQQKYRFVHFYIQQELIDPVTFKEAIEELFTQEIAILWENEYQGIIIEEQDETEESISYNQIIDVLMSDLYVKIKFFVGPFQDAYHNVKHYYNSIIEWAKAAYSYSKTPVTTHVNIIPYFLINHSNEEKRRTIAQTVLHDFMDDHETLKMIETFINCNLNVSETAKELYLHRNSLQYRLDKFTEKTKIDIRQFHEAMSVYLSLIVLQSS